jgi:cobalt-zinc-cadmium efflux system membrane fusion protein
MSWRWVLQLLMVLAVLTVGGMAGLQIVQLEPAATSTDEEGGHGHEDQAGDHEHGDEAHTNGDKPTASIQIELETARAASIKTVSASPARIRETLILQGHVEYDAARVRRVVARYPGVVLEMGAEVGDRIDAGESLAEIESSDSLQTYAVHAPISGIVTERSVNPGETTSTRPLYVIVDVSRVWVDLAVFGSDLARIQVGQPVRVHSLDEELEATGKIGYISPNSSSISQTTTARIFLNNPRGIWRPGMAVTGKVTVREESVTLAVRNSALQTYEGANVVFVENEDTYEVRKLKLGRTNGEYTEVLSGLEAGSEYVVRNSYLIKAELEKGSTEHAH